VMRALWVMMTMVMMMMTEASLCGWRVCWKYRPGTERASMRYIPCLPCKHVHFTEGVLITIWFVLQRVAEELLNHCYFSYFCLTLSLMMIISKT